MNFLRYRINRRLTGDVQIPSAASGPSIVSDCASCKSARIVVYAIAKKHVQKRFLARFSRELDPDLVSDFSDVVAAFIVFGCGGQVLEHERRVAAESG